MRRLMIKSNSKNRNFSAAFTIVELLIVIVVIGILAAITIIAYNGVQQKARDKTVLIDISGLSKLETMYGLLNNTAGKDWYSGNGVDSDLKFTPSQGNIIDVVTSSTDYCIRAYNPGAATYKSLAAAATRESKTGACSTLVASATATAAEASAIPGWSKILAGKDDTCAIAANNKAYCWGLEEYGGLGNGGNLTEIANVPVAVDTGGALSGKTIVAASAGWGHTCAVASDGKAYCWGDNSYGQLGDNSSINSSVPVAVYTGGVLSGKTIVAIEAGYFHTCAVASDGKAYCWGDNSYGQLGDNSSINSSVPVAVYAGGALGGKTITAMSISHQGTHTCAIASDNKAYCWGYNSNSQLGYIGYYDERVRVPVAVTTSGALSGKTIIAITAGYGHSCAIASDNNAYCWGNQGYGVLGNGSTSSTPSLPTAVTASGVLSGKTVVNIKASAVHTCAIASDNKAYCWGYEGFGALGNGSTSTNQSFPVPVDASGVLSGKTVVNISVGRDHTCAIDSNKLAYCWGTNAYGQLGNNSTNDTSIPVSAASPPTP